MRKVFGIGLSKTGTHSLATALRRLGYKTKHFPPPKYVLEMAEEYDALVDTPTIIYMEELDKRYPDALFILTIREIESWVESCRKHWTRTNIDDRAHKNRSRVYGIAGFDEKVFRQVYHKHHKRVRNLFGDRPGKLLEMNIVAGEGYEKLCPALDKPIIDEPFPHKYAAPEEG